MNRIRQERTSYPITVVEGVRIMSREIRHGADELHNAKVMGPPDREDREHAVTDGLDEWVKASMDKLDEALHPKSNVKKSKD